MFQLKPIAKTSIQRALEKAERYRLLNEPRQAESICMDVLAIEPEHQQALSCLLLALTDQFGGVVTGLSEQAKQLLPRFTGAYERAYYAGIISERYGKHQLAKDHPGARYAAYEYLVEAIKHYDDAEKLAPPGNDDAILRHNTCVRIIERHRLQGLLHDDQELPLE
jgi:tetratricopeptide (TPR) repeat protein